jgi:hypothetical protein
VRVVFAIIAVAGLGCATAVADEVPLPRPRPVFNADPRSFAEAAGSDFKAADLTTAPSDCRLRLAAVAVVEPVPRLIGPGECGGIDMVRLKAVVMPDNSQIAITPPPELRCAMAEAITGWIRDDLAPKFSDSPLRAVANFDDYECRGRNRVFGARLSEHGKGNALDVRALKLANGETIDPTDVHLAHDLRETLRQSACARFSTVLGPGADGHHEGHIHLDLAERRGSFRMCRWEVRDPLPPSPEIARADVPLPLPRPAILLDAPAGNDKRKL